MIKCDHAQKECVKETDGNNVYSMISPYRYTATQIPNIPNFFYLKWGSLTKL